MSSSIIGTFSGLFVDPLSLRPQDINIVDVAHSLSMQCRFGGHCTEFYSVAQHSVNVSLNVPKEAALWGLLHDASEAYLKDIPRPLKHSSIFEGYRRLEEEVNKTVAKRFGLSFPMPSSIKDADNVELLTEGQSLHPAYGEWWKNGTLQHLSPRDERIFGWAPARAEEEFLNRFYELGGVEYND